MVSLMNAFVFHKFWHGLRLGWKMWTVVILGCFLNLLTFAPLEMPRHDEQDYTALTRFLSQKGLFGYSSSADAYLKAMYGGADLACPPTRFAFVAAGALVHWLTGVYEHRALALVAAVSSIIYLVWCAYFSQRIMKDHEALAVLPLLSCAPLRLHLGGKAMIDGFYTMWAMFVFGSIWFVLITHGPAAQKWLNFYGVSLVLLIMTKEAAVFIWLPIVAVLLITPKLGLPLPTSATWKITFLAPMVSVAFLALLSGGWERFVELMTVFYFKAQRHAFSMLTGDGPWYRYLLDLFMLTPMVVLLSFVGLFQLRSKQYPLIFLASFIFISYVILSQLKHGGNLRYTAIWEFPMRIFVVTALSTWTKQFASKQRLLFYGAIFLICAQDLYQYHTLFVEHRIYEPTPESILRAIDVIKSPEDVRETLGRSLNQ